MLSWIPFHPHLLVLDSHIFTISSNLDRWPSFIYSQLSMLDLCFLSSSFLPWAAVLDTARDITFTTAAHVPGKYRSSTLNLRWNIRLWQNQYPQEDNNSKKTVFIKPSSTPPKENFRVIWWDLDDSPPRLHTLYKIHKIFAVNQGGHNKSLCIDIDTNLPPYLQQM